MDKKWLDEKRETPFVFDGKELAETAEKIGQNALLLGELKKPKIVATQEHEERQQVVFDGFSAYIVENGAEENNMPPFTDEMSDEQKTIIEGYSHAEAFMLKRLKQEPFIYPDLFKSLHERMFVHEDNLPTKDKGQYRKDFVVTGMGFDAIDCGKIEKEMNYAFFNYGFKDDKLSTEERFAQIAKLHAQIVRIQPFIDGNKRIAFLATNAMLKLYGYPIIDLCKDKEESEKYHLALETAIVERDVTQLAGLIANKVKHRQNETIKSIRIKEFEDRNK